MLFPRCYVTSLVALLTGISSTTTSQKMVGFLSSWWSWISVCSLDLQFQILSHLISSLNFGRRTWLFLFWLLTHVLNWLQAYHSYDRYNTLLASFCWKRDRCALMQTVYASLVEQCMHVVMQLRVQIWENMHSFSPF